MKLYSKLKRVSNYFFIISIIFMIIMIGCSVPGSSGGGSGSSEGSEEITMSGSFSIKVDPNTATLNNSSFLNYSINPTEYTVTALDITVTYVSTGAIVGTFNWTPPDTEIYSVNIEQYGEYEISVVQTAVNDSDPEDIITTEDSVIVDIQPMKITVVTIVPGGSLYIVVDGDSEQTYAEFPEDFDSTALDQVPNGWIPDQAIQTYVGVIKIDSDAHSSPNCLKLYDANDTDAARAYALIEDSIYGQLYCPFTLWFQQHQLQIHTLQLNQ